MTYVITGATGNTGGIIASRLLAQDQQVRVIGRSAERLQSLVNLGGEPHLCDLTDTAGLAAAFTGARAVYAMIPPNLTSPDYRGYQGLVSHSIATALAQTGVKHVVALSSVGADKSERTGPVLGLHYFAEQLNRIPLLNVLHLRAGYFMENTLSQIGVIKTMGVTAGPLRPDLKLPMIATRDIASAAAEALLRLDFSGQQTRELLGQRDISMQEATTVIGKAIDKPQLAYVQVSDEQFIAALTQLGMSSNVAGLILEMSAALNSGHMAALETRSAANTTETSYETFVAEEFVPRFRGQSAAA